MNEQIEELKSKLKLKKEEISVVLLENRSLASENKKLGERLNQLESDQELARLQSELINFTEEKYHSLFDNMLEGFAYCKMIFDNGNPIDFICLEVNKSFEHLTGLKNAVGKNVSEVIPGIREFDPNLLEICGRAALTGRPEKFEMHIEPLNNWFTISVCSPQKEYFIAIFDIITERKNAEEKMKIINNELENRMFELTAQLAATNKSMETFAYSVSHDLKTPLRHIDGFTRLLKNSIPQKSEETIRYFDKITQSSNKMVSMIDALLTFSRLGRKPIQKTEINLSQLVNKVIKQFEPGLENRNIEWHIGELPILLADNNLLQLVLENLIFNAIKFTSKNEKAIIEIANYDNGESGCKGFYIKDNGVGFDMAYANKLFGVFQRLHAENEFEGTGIGLANIKQIVNKHGGAIRAESELSKGATFFITFKE